MSGVCCFITTRDTVGPKHFPPGCFWLFGNVTVEALAPWTRATAGEQRRNWISKYFVLRGYLLCWSHHTTSDVDFEIVNVSFLSIQIKKHKHISTQFSHKSHPLTQLKTSWPAVFCCASALAGLGVLLGSLGAGQGRGPGGWGWEQCTPCLSSRKRK